MPSKKASSADNQQERIELCGWITGFVDGEGSFLVNLFKSPKAKMGWQIFPEFNVSQTLKGKNLLLRIERFFGCGHIYIHRTRMEKEKKWDILYKYCVRSKEELKTKIIPFFEKYPPKGINKKKDFKIFIKILGMIEKKKHLSLKGMRKIANIIIKDMTHRKESKNLSAFKFLLSSETIRRAPR